MYALIPEAVRRLVAATLLPTRVLTVNVHCATHSHLELPLDQKLLQCCRPEGKQVALALHGTQLLWILVMDRSGV